MDNKIEEILNKYKRQKGQLVSILQDVQKEHNYLPKEAIFEVSRSLDIPLTQVYSVATFFKAFSLKPRGRHIVSICLGTACHVRGAVRIIDKVEQELCIKNDETTSDNRFTLETVNCVGACALGPMIIVDGDYAGQMTTDKVAKVLKKYE
ncbi:MAG: NADH-quinone oxidoreductase subunit NuoE [Chloroflexi bacterium]|nr:NADH-quinone oxidoreductase subunit NuoE [Chloroflexota bacterium]